MSEELLAALDDIEDIKVGKLVEEFLSAQAQSLKILPQAPFGDAVNQFVDKDDKHAMESFVSESLSEQVRQMLLLEGNEADPENMYTAMGHIKQILETQYTAGNLKQARRRKYKPKPDLWDSDLDGHWEDQPQAIDHETTTTKTTPQISQPKGRGRKAAQVIEDEDDDMEDVEPQPPAPKTRARGRPAAAAAAKPKATPAKKAPAKGRGRKAQLFEQSEEEEEEDVVMDDDDFDPPPPPKRTTTRTTTARATSTRSSQASKAASTAVASKAAPKPRQTKLNFSQKASQQEPLEISDDEISDDFESVPETRTRRR